MATTENAPRLGKRMMQDVLHRHAARKAAPVSPHGRLQSEMALLLSLLQTMATQQPHLLGHGDRTAFYALPLGKAIGLSAADLIHLHYAALLHDIGQLTLPDTLLRKDSPLSAEEYEQIQSHPRAGAELLEPVSFLRVPALWIAHHHERWDGSGYPYGLRGSFIPLGARILAVADTFDALTSERPHSAALGPETAMGLLQVLAGSQLDPDLIGTFVRLAPGLTSTKDT
ncbi:MAG: HD domain-containing protein [Nitrospira sp.]|nr:HD domain-containing protein [Nitrospira sp.]